MRVLQSRHYRIHTDIEPAFAEELSRRMDAMYDEYQRRLVEFKVAHNHIVFEVYLFNKRSDYLRFTENRGANTGGVFMPGRNILAAFLEGQGRDGLRRTLQHEAFHQFAWRAFGPKLPIWLNEGMAQLFEESLWTGRGFLPGQVPPRRVRQLQAEMQNRRLTHFPVLMAMGDQEWADTLANDPDQAGVQYNQSWAMVHFLVHDEQDGQHRYRARLLRMLRMLHDGEDADTAFRRAFSDNVQGFQDRWLDYARKLTATPEATLIEHQTILADMLMQLNTSGQRFTDIQQFRETLIRNGARLRYTKGQIEWSTEPNPMVYFSNLRGQPFSRDELFLEPSATRPLPDIVCRCSEHFQLRTRFHAVGQQIEHEVLIEPVGK